MVAATFQMQTWRAADRCTCSLNRPIDADGHAADCQCPTTTHSWVPMENGAAPARWKPKPDAREAVKQAANWAGAVWGVAIPAMQVVELPSGRVIWRDTARYPDAGPPIAPSWQTEVYAAAQAEYAEDAKRRDEQTPHL